MSIIRYKNLPTSREGIRVHITGYTGGDTGCTLRGYAVDDHGVRIDGSKTLRRIAKTAAAIPAAEQHLVAAAMKNLPRAATKTKKKTDDVIDTDHPLAAAFAEVRDAPQVLAPHWNDAVAHRWLMYFQRNILPILIAMIIDDEIRNGENAYDALAPKIAEKVKENGRSSGVDIVAMGTAKNTLSAAQTIYDACRLFDPSLPVLKLAPVRKTRIQREQCKSLPRDVRRRLARELRANIKTEPLMVIGAVLMWDAGARTAEAAAVIPEIDIVPVGKDGEMSLLILWQEKEGVRSAVLKTSNAYRCVPLSFWGIRMIEECLKCIDQKHYSNVELAPIRAKNLSKWVANLLRECGLSDVFVKAAQEDEMRNPDIGPDGKPIYDVTAYILRRDRASRWRNVCGFSSAECDYLLGHEDKKAKKEKVDYTLSDEQSKLAKKLERYVYDPEISAHPGIRAISIEHGMDYDFIPFEGYKFKNDTGKTVVLKLDSLAVESAESIVVHAGPKVMMREVYRRSVKNHGRRNDVPIIGTGQIYRRNEV